MDALTSTSPESTGVHVDGQCVRACAVYRVCVWLCFSKVASACASMHTHTFVHMHVWAHVAHNALMGAQVASAPAGVGLASEVHQCGLYQPKPESAGAQVNTHIHLCMWTKAGTYP